MSKRILILGAGGLLGHKLCQLLSKEHYDVYGTFHQSATFYRRYKSIFNNVHLLENVDVLDEAGLNHIITSIRPDVIINAVGIVKQIAAAHDHYLSVGINSFLPHRLAKVCERIDSRLIHISTDCVFDGKDGYYTEASPSNCTDLYGKSKFLGETAEDEKHAITLRTSIIGHELKRPTHGLLEWAILEKGRTVKGFKNAFYTGFSTPELTKIIQLLIEKYPRLSGTYHVASHRISKYDLLQMINKQYKLNLTILPEDSFCCDRSLVMERFSDITHYQSPTWEVMIKEMFEDSVVYPVYETLA